MAQILHGSAITMARTRIEFQRSEESVAALARRRDVNPKTVAKWRNREGVEDLPTGLGQSRSTVLTPLEKAASSPSGCRLGCRSTASSVPPRPAREPRGRFKVYEIGYFHVDIGEARVE